MKSHSKKFIFIHIPKTAGNAVQKILMPYSNDRIYRKHYLKGELNDFEIESELGECKKHEWIGAYIQNPQSLLEHPIEDYYKFCVVRNPWERMVSFYCWSTPRASQRIDKKHFLEVGLGRNMPSMWNYISYNNSNQMDYVIRYENLEGSLKEVCHKIGIPFEGLKVTNASKHPHYSEFYNDESLEKIQELYKEDIEYFGYEFEEA